VKLVGLVVILVQILANASVAVLVIILPLMFVKNAQSANIRHQARALSMLVTVKIFSLPLQFTPN